MQITPSMMQAIHTAFILADGIAVFKIPRGTALVVAGVPGVYGVTVVK